MTQNSASRVGEIFTAAGVAFTRLGELSMALHSGEPTPALGRWDNDDVEQLRAAVKRFGEDMNRISDNIKAKTITQLKAGIKRKAVDDAKGVAKKFPVSRTVSKITLSPPIDDPYSKECDDFGDGQLSNSHVQVKSIN